jgi:hypothetical protein
MQIISVQGEFSTPAGIGRVSDDLHNFQNGAAGHPLDLGSNLRLKVALGPSAAEAE